MASKAKPTCITCRERKIRCDGQNPCSRCRKTRKPTVCQYELGSDASLRVGLPKGVACAPCRQKKKRCDGNRPCDACTSIFREDDCKSPPPTVRRPPRARIAPMKVAALIEDAKAPWKRCLKVSRDCSAIPQALAFSFPSRATEFYTRLRIHGDEGVELGLMRDLFLQHAWQFGFNISPAKRNAIRLGDTSGRFAPPIYVPLAQLMGYMLSDPRRTCDEYQYVGFAHSAGELDQIQTILGYLREGNGPGSDGGKPDPLTCMQVYRLLGAYCGIRADTRGSREFMGNASNLLLKHAEWMGINVASEESSTTDEEGLSALSHLVYLEAIMTTLRKIQHGPQLPPGILAKFMHLVAQAEQRTEATFVKAKSALFLVETQNLVNEWHDWQSGTFDFTHWTQRFCALARKLNTHLLFVQQTQRDLAHSNASRGQLVSYCGCAMITLTAIAEMYAVFAPFHHAPRVKFQEVVSALRRVQSTLAEQECRLCTLDVSAGVVGREIREEQPTVQWMLYMDTVLFPIRTLFLEHVWRYGLNIGAAKRDAIALGDTSGRVVHPIYINVAQLIGYILANPHHSGGKCISYERTRAEAAQAQIVFAYLREPDWDEGTGTDPLTYIQIYRLLAAYCTLKADRRGSREFVGNASNLMLRHAELLVVDGNIGCTTAVTTQELTPDEEARSALSHLVYLEAVAGTILKEDHAPQLPPAMLAKFMALSASLGDREVEVNYVKAKSALLFVESKNIIAEWDEWPSTGRFDGNDWTQRFCALARKLNTHLLFVQRVQNGFAQSGAPRGQLISFTAGTMLTLAAIAELYAVFAPFHPAPRTKFHEVVGAIRRVDRRLVEQERALFDCTLDICDAIASKEMHEQNPTSQWTAYMDTVLFPMYLSTLI
ncbi:hypothetical protein HMN09_00389600 [Mycena chlorophos]|uniref:Zn(2)-C6 fungal-type domain-containing protein n=1 Tax=Mycena chlorophos TaxID=658473 RepID=A0A8H6TJB5_MYCCL|nr:hypothetical protein HMN09_00389600 [Mycena chlorophos]